LLLIQKDRINSDKYPIRNTERDYQYGKFRKRIYVWYGGKDE